jgi:outer membrane protein OmpA-like peptidoglycan-associated protein
MRRTRFLFASSTALLLAACASIDPALPDRPGVFSAPAPNAPGSDPNTAPRPGTPGAPPTTPLATEQRFLEDWFRGTPVVIAAQPPTTLQLDVPLANSFDAGKADIKPALNAVLDRVAQSLLRHAGARITVSAPADATGPATLAQARAQRVRDSLATKGVAATRVSLIESARAGSPVQLRLSMPTVSSQPVAARRSEGDRPRGGVQPVSTQRPSAPTWTEKKQP